MIRSCRHERRFAQRVPKVGARQLQRQQAAERGAFGIPTFFVGDEMFFGKERIIQIEEMIQQSG